MWPFSDRKQDLEQRFLDLLEADVLKYAEADPDLPVGMTLTQLLKMEGETPQQRTQIVKYIRKLVKTNTHVRGILRTYVKYIARAGFAFNLKDAQLQTRWNQWAELNDWPGRQKLIVKRALRDGEVMVWWQQHNGMLLPRFLDPLLINNNNVSLASAYKEGVKPNPDDPEQPESYLHQNFGEIPADEVTWYRTDDEMGCGRSWPWFWLIAMNAKSYRAWLDDRIKLNRLRTAVAMVRKHPRKSKAQVQSWLASRKNAGSQTIDPRKDDTTVDQERWRGAQVFDLHGEEDLEFKRPNIDARDARYDGRALLLTLAASTGLAEYMVTGDAANNAYASALVSEGPAVVEFESFQSYFEKRFKSDCLRVLEWMSLSGWKGDENLDVVEVAAPRIKSREILDETRANETLYDNEAISRREWQRREGVDPEVMARERGEEEGEELGVGDTDVRGGRPPENPTPPEDEETKNAGAESTPAAAAAG